MSKRYKIYGQEGIEEGALRQMRNVMSLEPVIEGALMPDAHQGYGMPIGGVARVRNALIPYAVGVDIGCRMHLTVFRDIHARELQGKQGRLAGALRQATHFGPTLPEWRRDGVLVSSFFDGNETAWDALKKTFGDLSLRDRAAAQLGTSGGGNHFVEWGIVEFDGKDYPGSEPALALLSHSGSRALGYAIANKFTEIAARVTPLEGELKELSWLPINTQEGVDYWKLMNLAGEYSRINHQVIHDAVARAAGLDDASSISTSNHHNFAWAEEGKDGATDFIHRKGATPAGLGELGIIPGSMATPAFIVEGLGSEDSIQSASHGAGRAMSRSKALKTITLEARTKLLADAGVELISAGLDESPQAYKDIHTVMSHQTSLVRVLGRFHPKIVRMGGKVADEGD